MLPAVLNKADNSSFGYSCSDSANSSLTCATQSVTSLKYSPSSSISTVPFNWNG